MRPDAYTGAVTLEWTRANGDWTASAHIDYRTRRLADDYLVFLARCDVPNARFSSLMDAQRHCSEIESQVLPVPIEWVEVRENCWTARYPEGVEGTPCDIALRA